MQRYVCPPIHLSLDGRSTREQQALGAQHDMVLSSLTYKSLLYSRNYMQTRWLWSETLDRVVKIMQRKFAWSESNDTAGQREMTLHQEVMTLQPVKRRKEN
ncbi:hypothetical protein E2C01_031277 [Portunus trituberculatus]|uniref:Uncharacterized protein n=1 Tax=Portunus trituberculatus TaxID=210409 RepID=A0A5B7EX68_PORTR|nr:hypothetical protein [Portunus trituberculatus]